MIRLFLFLLFAFVQIPVHALETGYGISQSYHNDPVQSLTIEALPSVPFTPLLGDLRQGFQPGYTWIKLQIHPPKDAMSVPFVTEANPLVLRLGPYLLDDLVVYERVGDRWTAQQGGDRHPRINRLCPDDLHCFVLAALTPDVLYVRLKTAGLRLLQARVAPRSEMTAVVVERSTRITVALTLSIALLILSLAFFVIERAVLLHVFCWFQASVVLYICTTTGVLTERLDFLSPQVLDDVSNLAYGCRVAMTALLGWAALVPYRTSALYQKTILTMMVLIIFSLLLIVLGHREVALKINLYVFFLNPLIQIGGILSARDLPKKLRIVFLTGYTTLYPLVVVGVGLGFGMFQFYMQSAEVQHLADWRLNGLPIGALVFWIVITEKSKRNLQKLQELQTLRLEAAQAAASEDKLKERSELIDMLTHELKTPLSTIKFALASLMRQVRAAGEPQDRVQHIDASVNRMNAVIEHVAQSNKIERTDAQGTVETMSAEELMGLVMDDYSDPDRFELRIQDGAFFRANPYFLTVIIENLVSNAYKYASEGKIWIDITQEDVGVTRFQISNRVAQGCEPDEARLFERYYRHPGVQSQSGMGIGLSLVHSAAEKMGASVHYQNSDHRVVFEVRIPH
jgi:two-component system, sensor histidine kinase LadS